jgi:phosphate:Na+ symporter
MGANIGTTVTAQLIAFKLTDLAMPAIFIGVCLIYFARSKKFRSLGEVSIGFGLLFLGLLILSTTLSPLSQKPEFIAFFTNFAADNFTGIILNVLAGAVLTMSLHSSSVAVGITMVLASQGLLTLPGAAALVLGDNIGSTITAEMAAIGSSIEARRLARAHCMFNVMGVSYLLLLFYPFLELVQSVTAFMGAGPAEYMVDGGKPNIARYVANAHTVFNVMNTVVFLVALPVLIKVATVLTFQGKKASSIKLGEFHYINANSIQSITASLIEVRKEIARMAEIAHSSYLKIIQIPLSREDKYLSEWQEPEAALNNLQRRITGFLVQVSQGPISSDESNEISLLLRITNNVERAGDSIENLARLVEQMLEQGLEFTDVAKEEYEQISGLVSEFMLKTVDVLNRRLPVMSKEEAGKYENAIDTMRDQMRDDHVNRLRQGQCSVEAGLVFVNMLVNFERIGDYMYNISLVLRDLRRVT